MRLGRSPLIQRLWLGLGLVLALALTGCGGAGSKYNEFVPTRIIVIGDEITYVGCTRGTSNGQTVCAGSDNFDRFAINSISGSSALTNNWVVRLAQNYGLSTDKIIEPLVTGDAVRAAKLGAIATGTPTMLGAVSPTAVSDQALLIPSYVTGDMVVVAGGANDILEILQKSSVPSAASVALKRGLTSTLVNEILSQLGISSSTISTDKAFQIVKAAQDYQDIALDLINTKGQRHVFLAPIYDFSNSPDRNVTNGFCSGCTQTQIQQGIALFNYMLRLLTDSRFEPMLFRSGDPRILVTSGTTSYDLFYVNIPYFTNVFGSVVNNYSVVKSVCGASATDISTTNTTSISLVSSTFDLRYCTWNGAYDNTASFSGDPAFVSSSGAYIYTKNQYLTPAVHVVIGNTFSTFMRGFNGW